MQKCGNFRSAKRPIQFAMRCGVVQDRNARAISRFQIGVVVDEYAVEIRRVRVREFGQRQVAQMTVVTLIKNQGHGRRMRAAA